MKKILIALSVFVVIFTLWSCTDTGSRLSPDNPVTLNMWHVYGSQTKSPLNDAIDEFNRTTGREEGIIINVVSVTSSSAIDTALLSSSLGEPGAEALPDLFTAYPRVAEIVGKENLLAWDNYFTADELSDFNSDFISEGYFGGKLLMLPIAKSSEVFYLNKTLFDRFAAETGADMSSLSSFDGLFEISKQYYDWSGGMNFTQINDYYHYFLLGMKCFGEDFIKDGKVNCESPTFEALWNKLASCAIYGGLCLDDGYAAARWKTAEVISNIGSTADILYQPEMVFYADNTSEKITSVSFPYPSFGGDGLYTVQRGGGLFGIKNDDERKNKAAYIFAKWITQKENNIPFVTEAGYLPVKNDAFEDVFESADTMEHENRKMLYKTVNTMIENYSFVSVPLFDGSALVQRNFENKLKPVLKSAHNQLVARVNEGEDNEAVLRELVSSSLSEFKSLCNF